MPGTQTQVDFLSDFGLADDETVFSYDEIDRLIVRAGEAYPDSANVTNAYSRVLGVIQLKAKAVNLHDYTQGESQEKFNQVFKNIESLEKTFKEAMTLALSTYSAGRNPARFARLSRIRKPLNGGWDA